jgi:hypothetical protein
MIQDVDIPPVRCPKCFHVSSARSPTPSVLAWSNALRDPDRHRACGFDHRGAAMRGEPGAWAEGSSSSKTDHRMRATPVSGACCGPCPSDTVGPTTHR